MKARLIQKIERIRADSSSREFILADAKDADMAWGIASPGEIYPPARGRRFRTMPEFHEQIRAIARQGLVDVVLASISTMSTLAHGERLFDGLEVTPAVRINDTTDVWCGRGARYREYPSLPFASGFIEEAQYGSVTAAGTGEPVVNLGLYSVTLNNELPADQVSLHGFREFSAEAERKGFHYFLEVFGPNLEADLAPEAVPDFVNDNICRMLAGVPPARRPVFLKIPYFGPRALEELVAYDPSIVVGVLGGSAGTTRDAFHLLEQARKHGARVALFGRKIKEAEAPLAFITFLRRIADGEIAVKEAVKAYHAELQAAKIPPRRPLEED